MAAALQPKGVKIAIADPKGSALFEYYAHGELGTDGSSITEGIGQGRITANLEGFTPDFAYQVPDEEALPIIFDLLREEGLVMGGSTGINIAGAIRLAQAVNAGDVEAALPPQHRIGRPNCMDRYTTANSSTETAGIPK